MHITSIPFKEVPQFSDKDIRYTTGDQELNDFIEHAFEYNAFKDVIEKRKTFGTDRALLKNVLDKQYAGVDSSDKTQAYLEKIGEENSYTVTTAHQPSLLTGPLYYTFKILSTIRLAQRLEKDHPDYNFIPVFVLGAEDHDFEEVNHLHLFGKRIEWQSDQTGSVGRFKLDGLTETLEEIGNILGERSLISDQFDQIVKASKECKDYAEFSFRVTHLLFDAFGLVILRMDDTELKRAFIPYIKEEIFNAPSQALIEETQNELEKIGFSKQAHAREINFFYQSEAGRNRLINKGSDFEVLDAGIQFKRDELEKTIEESPQSFSPNVVMRPIYQELILPNLAYIGGGGELAYWMERKSQFEHYKMPFPMLIRRNSGMLISDRQMSQINELSMSIKDMFAREDELIKDYIEKSDQPDYSLEAFHSKLEDLFADIEIKVKSIEPTLAKTTQAELAKAKKSLDYLESKLGKSIKQKEEVQLNRLKKLKEKLFPSGLQERHDNILEYLSMYGMGILQEMLEHMDVFNKDFKVMTLQRP